MPSRWPTLRAKHLYRVIDDRAGDRRPPLLAVSIHHGVVPRSVLTEDEHRADDLSTYKMCEPGDIVLNRMRAFQGAIGIAPEVGLVSPDYLVLRPRADADARYLHHLFRSGWFVSEMASRLRGIGSVGQGNVRTPRINAEDLGDIFIPLPHGVEQRAIADYLDRETARIDGLVAAKRRLTSLVSEELEAAVSATVWSGTVERVPLKRRVDPLRPIMYGIVLPGPDVASGVPIVKGGDVAGRRLSPEQLNRTTFEIELPFARARLAGGDLVFAIRGGIGDVEVVPQALAGANITQDVARIAPRSDVDPEWLRLVLRSHQVRRQVGERTTGATVRGLNIADLREVMVPASDPLRQAEDLRILMPRHGRAHRVRVHLARQIELLAEHRQALVTAAVTGEIDVKWSAA